MNVHSASMAVAASLLLAACASEAPAVASSFDSSAGKVVVTVLGDGFVLLDGVRMPLDAAVLRLRFRARELSADERRRFVVKLVPGPGITDDVKPRLVADCNRLAHELDVMEIEQLEYF